jgi:PAS domain S-box-containing protein
LRSEGLAAPYIGLIDVSDGLVAPHIGLLDLDESLTIRAVDAGFETLFGAGAAAVVGQPLDALISLRDRRGARLFHEKISHGAVHRVDMMLTLQVGGREALTRLLLWRRVEGWTACVEEIGTENNLIYELFATRERWIQIVKQSVEGVAVLDEAGRVGEFNAAFFQLLDLKSTRGVSLTEDAIRGAPFVELLHEESLAGLRACVREVERGLAREIEVQHRGRWLEIVVRPVALPRRRPTGAYVQIRDITARRHGELLKVQKEAAEAASAAKSIFLASMSHELRTPLNAIIGYCELLFEEARDREDAGLAEDLERIGLSAKHLLDLVRNVLDLSAIEAGRVTLRPEQVAIESLLAEVRAVLQPLAERHGTEIAVTCPEGLGTMQVDVVRLRQVLINLVGNAVKFTHDGTITIAARRAGDATVELAVRDTGVGIPPDKLAQLFQEFSRVEGSGPRVEGAGLGLVVSRRLVQLMGGEIRVDSEPGQGSVFTVTLPG